MTPEASSFTSETVRFDSAGGIAGGLLCRPDRDDELPAVVLSPSVFGLNDYIVRVAHRVAALGCACLALDFYAAQDGPPEIKDTPQMKAAVAALPNPRILDDIEAALGYLAGRDDVDGDRLGSLGFCVGGSYSLMAACRFDQLACAISFYGPVRYKELTENKPVSAIDMVEDLRCPWLGNFGEVDTVIAAEDVAELRERLRTKRAEIYTYPGAGHAFHEDHRPDVYRPVAATTAWRRTTTYLACYLQSGDGSCVSA